MNEMHSHHDDAEFRRLCDTRGPDDGINPRHTARLRNRRRRRNPGHHQLQLCKPARQAIDAAILCDCGDPVFALGIKAGGFRIENDFAFTLHIHPIRTLMCL